MKTLGATELAILRGFIRDVLGIINYDDTGVTDDLYDSALSCAEILGIIDIPRLGDDWVPDDIYIDRHTKRDKNEDE